MRRAPEKVIVGEASEEVVAAPEKVSPVAGERTIRDVLVAASVGAAAIHTWAAWEHGEHISRLVFFSAVATIQLWWAAVIRWIRDAPWSVVVAGAAANAAVVVIWVLSRTTGLPGVTDTESMDDVLATAIANPNGGGTRGAVSHVETFGVVDTTAAFLEIVVVVGVVLLARRRRRSGVLPVDAAPTSTA